MKQQLALKLFAFITDISNNNSTIYHSITGHGHPLMSRYNLFRVD